MSPQDELFDLLARLVGSLSPEDLADDPELSGMIGQLLQVLSPKSKPIPLHILERLAQIDNRIERFKQAADLFQAYDPEKLKQLADSLKEAGLMKSETDLRRAEKADLLTFPSQQRDGAKCSNCKYVNIQESYCHHPEVDQRLKDGPEHMCCSFWDSPGCKREWSDDQ